MLLCYSASAAYCNQSVKSLFQLDQLHCPVGDRQGLTRPHVDAGRLLPLPHHHPRPHSHFPAQALHLPRPALPAVDHHTLPHPHSHCVDRHPQQQQHFLPSVPPHELAPRVRPLSIRQDFHCERRLQVIQDVFEVEGGRTVHYVHLADVGGLSQRDKFWYTNLLDCLFGYAVRVVVGGDEPVGTEQMPHHFSGGLRLACCLGLGSESAFEGTVAADPVDFLGGTVHAEEIGQSLAHKSLRCGQRTHVFCVHAHLLLSRNLPLTILSLRSAFLLISKLFLGMANLDLREDCRAFLLPLPHLLLPLLLRLLLPFASIGGVQVDRAPFAVRASSDAGHGGEGVLQLPHYFPDVLVGGQGEVLPARQSLPQNSLQPHGPVVHRQLRLLGQVHYLLEPFEGTDALHHRLQSLLEHVDLPADRPPQRGHQSARHVTQRPRVEEDVGLGLEGAGGEGQGLAGGEAERGARVGGHRALRNAPAGTPQVQGGLAAQVNARLRTRAGGTEAEDHVLGTGLRLHLLQYIASRGTAINPNSWQHQGGSRRSAVLQKGSDSLGMLEPTHPSSKHSNICRSLNAEGN